MSDWSVGNINLLPIIRVQAGAACIAAGLGLYVTNPSIVSPMLPLAAVSMWCGVILSPRTRPPWPILAALAVIILSALIAIPLSKHLAPTVLLAILTISVAPLVLVKNPYIWRWLTPVWILHGVFAFWQWFVVGSSRVVGIADNANVAAVFLLLGSTYLLNGNGKARWMMIPLLMAILFTGSRWTVGVASVALLTIFLSRHVSWRYLAVGIVVSVAVTLAIIGPDAMRDTWIRPNTALVHITGAGFSSEPISKWPSLIPRGFFDNGIHSVPLRMMYETGLLSGVAWIVASGCSLVRRPDARWWMFLVVTLVSLLYYHAWVGPLAGFWWLLVSPQKETPRGQKWVPAVYEPYKPG